MRRGSACRAQGEPGGDSHSGWAAKADEAWNGAGRTMWETGCMRGGRVERAPPEFQVASWWGAEVLGDTRDGKDKLVCSLVIQKKQDYMSEAVGKKWESDCLGHKQPCTEEKASLPWMPEKKDRGRRKEPYNSKAHLYSSHETWDLQDQQGGVAAAMGGGPAEATAKWSPSDQGQLPGLAERRGGRRQHRESHHCLEWNTMRPGEEIPGGKERSARFLVRHSRSPKATSTANSESWTNGRAAGPCSTQVTQQTASRKQERQVERHNSLVLYSAPHLCVSFQEPCSSQS